MFSINGLSVFLNYVFIGRNYYEWIESKHQQTVSNCLYIHKHNVLRIVGFSVIIYIYLGITSPPNKLFQIVNTIKSHTSQTTTTATAKTTKNVWKTTAKNHSIQIN